MNREKVFLRQDNFFGGVVLASVASLDLVMLDIADTNTWYLVQLSNGVVPFTSAIGTLRPRG